MNKTDTRIKPHQSFKKSAPIRGWLRQKNFLKIFFWSHTKDVNGSFECACLKKGGKPAGVYPNNNTPNFIVVCIHTVPERLKTLVLK